MAVTLSKQFIVEEFQIGKFRPYITNYPKGHIFNPDGETKFQCWWGGGGIGGAKTLKAARVHLSAWGALYVHREIRATLAQLKDLRAAFDELVKIDGGGARREAGRKA